MKKIFRFIFIIPILFILCSCSNTKSSSSDFEYIISSNNPYIELNAGERVFLDFKTNFTLEDGENITFVSSDENVAKVLSTGYLLAKGKGCCSITVTYKSALLVYSVVVNQRIELVSPIKVDYFVDETIDLTGGQIILYNNDSTISKIVDIDESMISSFDTSTVGVKEVKILYQNEELKYSINVVEREFESYYIDSLSFDNTNIKTNEKLEINVVKNDLNALKEKITSLYDYEKYKIVLEVTTPSNNIETVYSFLTEDYSETTTSTTLNTSKNLEGVVNIKDGYNYKLTLNKTSSQYYKFRYYPEEVGTYDYVCKVYANKTNLIQTLTGEFNVSSGSDSNGVIKVSSNKKTFEFENGETILLVGENLAWYTSSQRRYKDYELWIESLKENNVNYVRIWLSAFGFSLFWKDYTNYDTKLDEAYELDKVFELLEENGIYCDLTIFHHGMFSKTTNPMWPNTTNTWYTSKYGANPYSRLIDDPKDYFTNAECLKWTENYLTYIASRYGYSTNLMSYEIFNEVDWVESYTSSVGNEWHDRMAKKLKEIDYRDHLVTTSVKGDDFTSQIYSVFKLDSIDYVNVHNYGAYNYLNVIPKKSKQAYSIFDKPIIYQEVGYDGNGGSNQIDKDPNDITLHQEIWAGMMSCGVSGMNWWWDSWIEVSNSYSKYKGASVYQELIDLSGNLELAYDNSKITYSNSKCKSIGYLFNNKAYLYVYSSDYTVDNFNVSLSSTISINNMDSGTYKVSYYNTNTGQQINELTVNTSVNKLTVSINTTNDIAIIIKKV